MEANVDNQLQKLIVSEYKLFFSMLHLKQLFSISSLNSFDGNVQLFCSRVLSSNIITDDRQDYESVSLRMVQMIDFNELDFITDTLFSSKLLRTEYKLYFHSQDNLLNELYVAFNVTNTLNPSTGSFVFVFSGVKSSSLIDDVPFVFDSNNYNYSIYEDLSEYVPLSELIEEKKLSIRDYTNILLQIVYALTLAKQRNEFKHNNLTTENVFVKLTKNPFQIKFYKNTFMITNVFPKIINLNHSSVKVNGESNGVESSEKSDVETLLESSRSYGMNTWKFVNDKMINVEEYLDWLLEQFPLYFRINQQQNDDIKGLYCEFNQQCFSDESLNEMILKDIEFTSLNSFFDIVMKENKIESEEELYSEEELEENLEKLIQIVKIEIDQLFKLKEIETVDLIQWNILKKNVNIIETITEEPIESKKYNDIQLKMIQESRIIKDKNGG
jgi:hypothetical protein